MWRRILISVGVFVVLAAPSAVSQIPTAPEVGNITGVAKDAASGKPLGFVSVLVVGTDWGAMGLEDGTFKIENVPVGTYDLLFKMEGYEPYTVKGVQVIAGQTVHVSAELKATVVAVFQAGAVTAKRTKKIDRSETTTRHTIDAKALQDMAVDEVLELVSMQPGVVAHGGELHFRGGRGGEVQFQVDGIPVKDPLVGTTLSLAGLAVESSEVLVGGLDAKYGDVQSGVVIYQTREGGDTFSGRIGYVTDDYGSPSNTFDNYDKFEIGLGGPTPIKDLTYYVSLEATFADAYPKTREKKSRYKVLDFISLGDRQYNQLRLQSKLAFRPTPNHKITFQVLEQRTKSDNYYHEWSREGYVQTYLDTTLTGEVVIRHGRWSPIPLDSTYVYYNAAEHTPDHYNISRQFMTVFTHAISENSQYTIRLSAQYFMDDRRVQGKKEWEYEGERERDLWYNYYDGEVSEFFVISGDYPSLSRRDTKVYRGMFELKVKKGPHTIEAGLSANYSDLRYFSVDRMYNVNAVGEIGSPRTKYHYYNPDGAAYIQDKWEHEGMVLNVGLRYDFFSVGQQIPISEVEERVKQQISPRVGIGYPISDRDIFSFHYGRLYQIPDRRFIYDNRNVYDGRTRGNPNLSNETTILYQACIKHLFSQTLSGDFSVYYKDIFGLITAEEIPDWTTAGDLGMYVNKDYASAKGFEVALNRSYKNYMRWSLSYTFSVAKGVASDPNAARSRNFAYLPTDEQPLDWDCRHQVAVDVYMGDYKTWGVTVDWRYATGTPYTPIQQYTREITPEMVNSRRLPSTTTVDVRLQKYYSVWGKRLSVFLQARNLLDAKNIRTLSPGNWPTPPLSTQYVQYYTETGRAGGAYLADHDHDGIAEFIPLNDPRVFDDPRTVRMGISFSF